jgi:parallel beta-helix repeat protein
MTFKVETLQVPAGPTGRWARALWGFALVLLVGTLHRATAGQTGPGYALNFNSGYVKLQNFLSSAPTNEVTVEFWQNVAGMQAQSTFCQSPPSAGSTAPDSVFNAHVPFVDGMVYWDFGNITLGGRLAYVPPVQIVNSWQHFAFVASQSGNYMAIYRNGNLEAFKVGMRPLVRTNLDLNLSGAPSGLPYHGLLDEFRIWKVARSQPEIATNMYRALSGTESNLVLCLHFNEGGGPVTQDATGSPINTGVLLGNVIWQHSTAPFVPEVSSLAAMLTSNTGAVLNANINPDSLPTFARFEWGPTVSMGNLTPLVPIGSNSAPVLFSDTISGLVPGTKYFFRAQGINDGGIVSGFDLQMTPMFLVTNNVAVTNEYDDPSDPKSFRYLLNHASNGTGITFPTLTNAVRLTNGPLVIQSDLSVTGNCTAVIDGLGTYQAFTPITNTVNITEMTFSNCFGANGGAISVAAGGSLTLNGCTFIGNTATSVGGALSVSGSGTLVLNRCTLIRNQAVNGGAIDTFGNTTLTSCTVVSNTASGNGGGLRLEAGIGPTLAVNNCTVAGNRAFSGGGIEDDNGTLTMQNSIVAYNSLTGGSGPDVRNSVPGFSSSGYNLIGRDNGSAGWKHSSASDDDLRGTLSTPLNPLLARPDNYGGCPLTMELLPGSPAIDTGSSGGLVTDQRGFTRPVNLLNAMSPPGNRGDIGAFEVQYTDLTNPPVLTIFLAETNVVLLWDILAKAYTLEHEGTLTSPPSWTPVPATPARTNGDTQLTVTRSASSNALFFRLRAP